MIETIKIEKEKFKDRIYTVFSHEPWWVEFWSAIAAILWSYISILSGDKIYYHSIFIELSVLADAKFWQISAIILGICQISSLIYNEYKLRWLICLFAAWFWTLLTLAVNQSEPHPPGLALYATFSCINLVSMIKLARSYG